MGEGSCSNTVVNRAEISRLLALARKHGGADKYTGKRQAARVSEGMQLEVTTDPNDASASWAVPMHDISVGGVAFWSKRDLPPYTYIHVREFSSRSDRPWLPARVKHRTVGIRGFLIGASFGFASSGGGKDASASFRPPLVGPPPVLPPRWHGPRR